ncbi:site-specific integrase [Gallaecimonas kandeliae]|uniref:tyrosine-type recombinase/integrase n=1 Tax=Gallaecimonas kandeliae TaxID=3029055 RepID=UPI0026484A7F|nr:site-specific integrase [Gallaecimonas kandeliae]WKE67333.1 site-specific integrase [Gallaecimonas kandeliae]
MLPRPPVLPLFDAPQHLEDGNPVVNQHLAEISLGQVEDAGLVYEHALDWLLEAAHNDNNYKTYRSELTTYLHWCFDVEQISPGAVRRRNLGRYVAYCQSPPKALIAYRNVAQFVLDKEWQCRLPNPQWRPFLGKRQGGVEQPYRLSPKALTTKLAILSSFYSYLIGEEYTEHNPAALWLRHHGSNARNEGRFSAHEEEIKIFSELQWSYIMEVAETLASAEPQKHERTLFLVSLLYGCYLRLSEVAARPGFSPGMGQFRRDQKTGIWGFFVPQSKGGKKRTVAVSKALLAALKRYRRFLGLPALPAPDDRAPLFVRRKAAGRGREVGELNANLGVRQLRDEVEGLIQAAADAMEKEGFAQDAREMRGLTAHSIRHTGITHDINLVGRPLSHVQADAGHDSIHTTSLYLHTAREERHQSAENKSLNRLGGIG